MNLKLILMLTICFYSRSYNMETKFDYVVDLSTIIYPDQEKASQIIEKKSEITSILENPVDKAYTYFLGAIKYCSNIIFDKPSLEKEMRCHLNSFLKQLTLPKDLDYTYSHNSEFFVENRETQEYNPSAPILCALMCAKKKKDEEILRNYVLEEFENTKHEGICSLTTSLKKTLSTTIEFMFSEQINDIMKIDTQALKIMLNLQKKHTTAFVYSMPGYVNLKGIKDEKISLLIKDENSPLTKYNFFTSGNIGHLTTDPLFYENIPLVKKPIYITTCNSNTLTLRDKGTFEKFYFYNYTEHKNLKDVLKSE